MANKKHTSVEEELDALVCHDTLLHAETLLVRASGDLDEVSSILLAE
jgi:hypothetical protein